MKLSQSEYDALLRQDFAAFLQRVFYQLHPDQAFHENWHIELIAGELEVCRRGNTHRLIVNLPPRSLKSIIVSVAFPAFVLGHDPTARIICVSYGQDLADKHARDARAVMESDWYRRVFATRLASNNKSIAEFGTTAHGFRMATSVFGVLTGRGADYVLLDDILKPEDAMSETQRRKTNDWYRNTLYSRLDNKQTGRIVIVQQRLHEDDLVGHVLAQDPQAWTMVRLPAIAEAEELHRIVSPFGCKSFVRRTGEALHPAREPLEVLEHVRRTLGEYHFAGQYQQSPAPMGGGIVKREWFKHYEPGERPAKFDQVVQSWDTANKAGELANYSVCTTWGVKGKHVYLLNVYRKQIDFPSLVRAVIEQKDAFDASVILVEDAASGVQLVQQLVAQGLHSVKAIKPEGDKVMRLSAQSTSIENGFVWVPREAHWLEVYLHELTTFPASKHADQVDSTSQALAWMRLNDDDPEAFAAAMKFATDFAEEQAQKREAFFREGGFTNNPSPW